MALALTKTRVAVPGASKVVFGTIAFDNQYPTNGEALTKDTIGLGARLDFITFENPAGFILQYDHANEKVKVFQGDNDNAGDAPLVEVANNTDLSALTEVRFRAEGIGTAAA